MATYSCRSREELRIEFKRMIARYEELMHENLNLDMSRGKPSKLQLDLVSDMLESVSSTARMPAITVIWPVWIAPVSTGRMYWAVSRSRPSLAATPVCT